MIRLPVVALSGARLEQRAEHRIAVESREARPVDFADAIQRLGQPEIAALLAAFPFVRAGQYGGNRDQPDSQVTGKLSGDAVARLPQCRCFHLNFSGQTRENPSFQADNFTRNIPAPDGQ